MVEIDHSLKLVRQKNYETQIWKRFEIKQFETHKVYALNENSKIRKYAYSLTSFLCLYK